MREDLQTSGVVEAAFSQGLGSFSQTSPVLTPTPGTSSPCESCEIRPATVYWTDPFDGVPFVVCVQCHPEWRDA